MYSEGAQPTSQNCLIGIKANKNKISPEIKKRQELIMKYKVILSKYKKKLEEEKMKGNKKNAKS